MLKSRKDFATKKEVQAKAEEVDIIHKTRRMRD